MPADLLEFEEPVGVLLKEIEALSMLPRTPERERSIETLRSRADEIRTEIFANLTAWQRVLVARHPNRPNTLDYVERLFTGWDELHGDRRFADDHAIVCGTAEYRGRPVAIVGHQKGRDTKQKIFRNFGYARPEGYRKALRVMQMAQKFGRPILVFIDTPAAYPGVESEERGVAEAIAFNLREMMMLEVPIIVTVCGEGGSGGALGIAIGDRVLMQEFSVYSVIPPEGCAAILWRDSNRKVEAAEALRITAPDLMALGLIDGIVPEPSGGAHNDYDTASALVDQAISASLDEVSALSVPERLDARYEKFRRMGEEGLGFMDLDKPEPPQAP
ncbi:MAG: acetyl-CoA carboxylase carboxyltransferase subunit alpha [Acidobacteria bacterium RIFCSPLOWO2_02_FULL_67_36]|nr:MAG: acetyl-CoA carboxylase carboxyltransferase subunit alpha [Acidobacteria bacterium RIFCSPLOWO2_02_FULL_67_36]OFW18646.1 MAG: acetyl-CoA carboxylase carboxyltransferase subunit alpha [Acidobacteria bacterium RIFCSPLOWO2_12_FULL_66_21]